MFEAVSAVTTKLWLQTVDIIPNLAVAAVIIIIGYLIAHLFKHIAIRILQGIKLDEWIEEQNLAAVLGNQKISVIVGIIVKIWVFAVFLAEAVGFIHLRVIKETITYIVILIPKILVAVLAFIVGLLAARFIRNLIEATTYEIRRPVAIAVEFIIIIFAGVFALSLVFEQKSVNTIIELIKIFIAPFIVAFAIALAVMFSIIIALEFQEEIRGFARELRGGTTRRRK